jgi:type IV pilus assembly protein PilB
VGRIGIVALNEHIPDKRSNGWSLSRVLRTLTGQRDDGEPLLSHDECSSVGAAPPIPIRSGSDLFTPPPEPAAAPPPPPALGTDAPVRAMVPGRPNIGKILLDKGVITQAQLKRALAHKQEKGCRLGEALIDLHLCTDIQIARGLAEQLEIPYVDLVRTPPMRRFIELIPRSLCLEFGVVAVKMHGDRLLVAARDPSDLRADAAVRQVTNLPIVMGTVAESQLREFLLRGLTRPYLGNDDVEPVATETPAPGTAVPATASVEPGSEEHVPVEKLLAAGQQLSTVRAVDSLIADAIRAGASDLHLKPEGNWLRVRHRLDGRLRTLVNLPAAMVPSVIARIKIMGSMDIAETRKPQDGGAQLKVDGRPYELRISTLPGIYGEVAVIRILNHDNELFDLEALGLESGVEKDFRRMLSARQGMILITGPTGSGKTTTLYAALSHLNTEDVNIITVEDPVEIKLPGISQVQVHEKAGRTFPTTLRAILRQDPDIVMVGEIRDLETAEIASRAALTGHLVLSTLHTQDTVGTMWRLFDMGIPRYIVTASLNAVVAQRLVRRVCPECAEPDHVPFEVLKAVERAYGDLGGATFRRGKGCPACGSRGTRGRLGVYELLIMDEELRHIIVEGAADSGVHELLASRGFRHLERDAFDKAYAGEIPVEELVRLGLGVATDVGSSANGAHRPTPASGPAPGAHREAPATRSGAGEVPSRRSPGVEGSPGHGTVTSTGPRSSRDAGLASRQRIDPDLLVPGASDPLGMDYAPWMDTAPVEVPRRMLLGSLEPAGASGDEDTWEADEAREPAEDLLLVETLEIVKDPRALEDTIPKEVLDNPWTEVESARRRSEAGTPSVPGKTPVAEGWTARVPEEPPASAADGAPSVPNPTANPSDREQAGFPLEGPELENPAANPKPQPGAVPAGEVAASLAPPILETGAEAEPLMLGPDREPTEPDALDNGVPAAGAEEAIEVPSPLEPPETMRASGQDAPLGVLDTAPVCAQDAPGDPSVPAPAGQSAPASTEMGDRERRMLEELRRRGFWVPN